MHHDASEADLILRRRKLTPRDANCLAQGHRAEEGWSLDLNFGIWLQSSCGHVLHGVLPGASLFVLLASLYLYVCLLAPARSLSLYIQCSAEKPCLISAVSTWRIFINLCLQHHAICWCTAVSTHYISPTVDAFNFTCFKRNSSSSLPLLLFTPNSVS